MVNVIAVAFLFACGTEMIIHEALLYFPTSPYCTFIKDYGDSLTMEFPTQIRSRAKVLSTRSVACSVLTPPARGSRKNRLTRM